MESKVNYTAVGVFVVLFGLMLAGVSAWLAAGSRQGNSVPYLVYATDNVNGLNDASNVLYRGVQVGKVASIEIDPANPALIRIKLHIDKDVPVRADTVAQLSPQGVTGLSVINLTGGHSSELLRAKPGQAYPVIPYAPSVFSRLEGGISEATVVLSKIANRLDLLLSNENLRAFSQTLAHVARVTQTVDAHRQDLGQTLVNLRQSSQELSAMGANAQQLTAQSAKLLSQLSDTTQQLQVTLGDMDEAARTWRVAGQGAVTLGAAGARAVNQLHDNTLPGLDRLTGNLEQLSSQLTELIRSLKGNPSQLLYGPPKPAAGPGEH